MPLRTFNPSEIAKLKQLMNEGIQVTGEVEALREGLKDTVKALAEELELKPAIINKAISIAHRDNHKGISDDMDLVDSILTAAGKI